MSQNAQEIDVLSFLASQKMSIYKSERYGVQFPFMEMFLNHYMGSTDSIEALRAQLKSQIKECMELHQSFEELGITREEKELLWTMLQKDIIADNGSSSSSAKNRLESLLKEMKSEAEEQKRLAPFGEKEYSLDRIQKLFV